ncbi:CMRF35-like molecule 9 isoform X3 [Hemiscyllium ocellatum]|uniref:CMRF35-like molecule 9 isoform X3 n=1 Tax=Hemiscyllium ocellatum TaxID=170820 RepID=UPI0029661623|nr:CMRF35-like molecule 9 isoform X3 [Hemiscyllium ocellatum]
MEKQVCWWLALFLFLDFTDSLTLTVPELVTGQLRNSVNIPCTYHPSPLYVELEVTWYFNTYTIIIRRDRNGYYIPRFNNRDRVSIKRSPGSGDVSLILKNLSYSDRGTYTCEVKWQTKHGLNQTETRADVNLIVRRALPSTRPPASLSPVVTSACEHLNELSSARYESFPYPASTNVVISGNNEYETMTTMKENEYSVICAESTCAYAQCHASV